MEQWIWWMLAYVAFLAYSAYRKRELIKGMTQYCYGMLSKKIGVDNDRP